jgi:hypothetical protein
MLVAFFDRDNDELTPQRKGTLLEALTRRLASEAGYADLVLRAKHSSLEYDIEGRSVLHGIRLTGEAKAHEANISGQVLSAFVGKLMPLAGAGNVHGLFISTSAFTAEARDYLETTLPSLGRFGIELRTVVGPEIPQFFGEHAGYATDPVLEARVLELYGLEVLDTWLVCSATGDFLVTTCGPNKIAAGTSIALFKPDGTPLELDGPLLDRLRLQHQDLAGLEPVAPHAQLTTESVRTERLPAVLAGAGSFDYRFPAPPEHFIGRDTPLSELARAVEDVRDDKTAIRAVQVLSRSGVGKSSLLLKTPTAIDLPFVTIDGRSIRTPADVRLVITEAVVRGNAVLGTDNQLAQPRRLEETAGALEELGTRLRANSAVLVIQIDQFESTLRLPSVFDALLNLVETSSSQRLPVTWVFARKNDVATTFDEGAAIDLGRLNQISYSIRLEDFTPVESRIMFEQLEQELGESLTPDLANAISTFSAGFPWLHKRLCAHVLTMRAEGFSQRELVQTGLRAEDLFDEDLAGLTEQDRALLRRLASHLPATASELAAHLEGEISAGRLTEKLNEFLGLKLLRLSGDIYDTYNDVFKTYLVTDQIPFEARYIYRAQPRAAVQLLRTIGELGPSSLGSFQRRVGGSRVANLNKMRELRLLGLINPKPGRVELTLETQEALEKDALGDLLRRRLRANGLVVRALDLVAAKDEVTVEELVGELRRELPQVDVAPATWTLYARTLASWLHFASLAQLEGDTLTARDIPADEALQGRALTRGAFAPDAFIPSARPEKIVALIRLFEDGRTLNRDAVREQFGNSIAPGVIRDAVALDLVEEGEVLSLGSQGRMLKASGRSIEPRDVAQLAMAKPNMKALLEATSAGPVNEAAQREIVARFGSAKWTDGTWRWRLGIIRSWLVTTGLVTSGRSGLRRP